MASHAKGDFLRLVCIGGRPVTGKPEAARQRHEKAGVAAFAAYLRQKASEAAGGALNDVHCAGEPAGWSDLSNCR